MASNLVESTVAQVSSPNPHPSLTYSMYDQTINRWGRWARTGSSVDGEHGGLSKRCGEEDGLR